MADRPKEEEEIQETKPKPKLSKKLILLVVSIASTVAILIITIIIVIVMTNKPEPKESAPPQDEIGIMVPMRDFLVNLIDYGGRRYLKVTMELEVDKAAVAKEIENKQTILRNYIINVLSSKTFNDIKSVEGKNLLRKNIIIKCNFVLKTGKVLNVYFNDFIIQ